VFSPPFADSRVDLFDELQPATHAVAKMAERNTEIRKL